MKLNTAQKASNGVTKDEIGPPSEARASLHLHPGAGIGPGAALAARARPGRLRVGVVGCGYWGSKHVRVLAGLAGVAGVAVIDREAEIRDALAAAFPAVRCFAELDAALPHIDALIVATPPTSHAAVALKAIEAGKHVLIEKPMTRTVAEAQKLEREARRRGVVLMAGHTFEFNPAVRELRRRIDQGELGQTYYIHSARLNLGLYRSDVDVVWDLAPHDISIMNYLLQASPSRVSAWGSANACREVNDLALIQLHYDERQVTGYIHVSWLDPRKVRRVTVVGSRKMAVYDDVAEERLRIFDCGVDAGEPAPDEDGIAPYDRPFSYRYGDIVSPRLAGDEPLALEDRHFVGCILEGTAPESDGASGAAVVAVLDAIDRALATGGTVEVASPIETPAEPAPQAPAEAGTETPVEAAPAAALARSA